MAKGLEYEVGTIGTDIVMLQEDIKVVAMYQRELDLESSLLWTSKVPKLTSYSWQSGNLTMVLMILYRGERRGKSPVEKRGATCPGEGGLDQSGECLQCHG